MMKNKKLTILIALLLTVSMLAGCGGNKAETTPASNQVTAGADAASTGEEAEEPAQTTTGEAVSYHTQYLQLEDSTLTAGLDHASAVGDTVYFTSLGVIADETPEGVTPEWPEQYWVYGPVLCKVGIDGSIVRLPYDPTDGERVQGENRGVVFEALCAAPEGQLWVLEKHYQYWSEASAEMTDTVSESGGSFHSEEHEMLVCVREDGTVVSEFPLDVLKNPYDEVRDLEGSYSFDVNGMAIDKEGHICLAVHEWFSGSGNYIQDNRICLVDPQSGSVTDSIQMSSTPEFMVGLPNGDIAVCCYERGEVIGLLDMETKSMGETVLIDDFVNGMASGGEEYSICFSAGNSVYGLNFEQGEEQGEPVKLFNWIDCDVARQGDESICVLADGRIITTASQQTVSGIENDLIILSKAAAGETSEKKVLRLAVMNLYPFTSKMVSRFNRSNPDYRIEVTDYSQYNDYASANEEERNAGINRLQTEIIAGDMPDILDISLLSADRLGSKGLVEDLYPYMDADPELNRSDLLEHVLAAFEENGKLYQTVGNFYILTTAGLSSVVGDQIGWNMDQFHEAMSKLQAENPNCTVFDRYTTQDLALTFLLYLELENYVDWSNGECRFQSDSFIKLLEFVKSFPSVYSWESDSGSDDYDTDTRLRMGLQLMKQCNFACFEDLQMNTAGLGGAPCTFVGYPTENGAGSMFAQIGNSFAITSTCADKDAAWQFIRQFFLPEYQEQFLGEVFPTNRVVYEKMKSDAMTPKYQRNPDGSYMLNEEGKRIEEDRGSMQVNGMTVPYKTATEEDVAQVEKIINATTTILHTDDSLKRIIIDGAMPYFADQRSVDEVVKLIQSKAMLYVNEQR